MIVPMYKYAFLVHHADHLEFVHHLRDLGVMHLHSIENKPLEEEKKLQEELKQVDEVIGVVSSLKEKEIPAIHPDIFNDEISPSGKDVFSCLQDWITQQEHIVLDLENIENDLIYARKWGDFSRDTMEKLNERGVVFLFFTVHERDFNIHWSEENCLEVLHIESPFIYFTVVLKDNEHCTIPLNSSPIPAKTIHVLEMEKNDLEHKLNKISSGMKWVGCHAMERLENYKTELFNSLELSEAIHKSEKVLGESLFVLQGFVPKTQESKITSFCTDANAIVIKKDVKPSDNAPILLENNRFTKLYEGIGELYSLPAYGEIDLTPFFAPFFMLFFGFCLGDAGYGILIFLLTFYLKHRVDSKWISTLYLARWLALATIIFGVLTGTFFCINLLESEVTWLKPLQNFMLDSKQTFNLALFIGLVQIIFGMFLNATNKIKNYGWQFGVSSIAWIFLILSLADWFVFNFFPEINQYISLVSCVLILFFNDPEAGFFSRLGKGIWELYGITGLVGDLLSYIRLFALGISSAILGMVINDIALRFLEIQYVGWILFVVFLLIGHSANILIASLGAFVHPLRLTFVEFYKNAGFTGGGKLYRPFGQNSGK